MGYLYCYSTLMGIWSILAITHVLIICGLVIIPESFMNPTLTVGERILENPSDPTWIVIPVLYGVQCFAWCGSLACIAVARAAASDPTLGFEIQHPKLGSFHQRHRLDNAHQQQQKMGRRPSLFSFRKPSVISPTNSIHHPSRRGLSEKNQKTRHANAFIQDMDHEPSDNVKDGHAILIPNNRRISQVVVTFRAEHDHIQLDTTRMSTEISIPEAAVVAPAPRSSVIYITNHNYGFEDASYTSIPFALPGESLSDMIFSAVQNEEPSQSRTVTTKTQLENANGMIASPSERSRMYSHALGQEPLHHHHQQQQQPQPQSSPSQHHHQQGQNQNPEQVFVERISESSQRSNSSIASTSASKKSNTDVDSTAEVATLSSTTTLDGLEVAKGPIMFNDGESQPSIPSILSKEQVHQLEKMQQQRQGHHHHHQYQRTSTWQLLMEQDQKYEMSSLPEETQTQVHRVHFPLVPARRSSFNNHFDEQVEYGDQFNSMCMISPPTAPQSNTSDVSHEQTSMITTTSYHANSHSSEAANEQPDSPTSLDSPTSPSSKTKSGIPSLPLKYWKKSRSIEASSEPASTFTAHSYFANAFSKRNCQNNANKTTAAATVASVAKVVVPQVPSIMLHPDEEDGEPPRMLTQQDIEYLSTAPPAPLRPLIQPWDEVHEEEEEDGHEGGYDDGDGYDDYDYGYEAYHRHDSEDDECYDDEDDDNVYEQRYDNAGFHDQSISVGGGASTGSGCDGQMRTEEDAGYDDPYALDVSINLEIDLQGLEQADMMKAGHGPGHGYEYDGYGYL
ncbi:hypothetical protein BGZ94_006827 [Podila epigama]|nr:hypothetical protein BGZ94_006827 [Podila epigama]